jgi:hypothetical protein
MSEPVEQGEDTTSLKMSVVGLRVTDVDGNPDPEALADLAQYLSDHGFPVVTATSSSDSATPETVNENPGQ